jgi:hypothetical protein
MSSPELVPPPKGSAGAFAMLAAIAAAAVCGVAFAGAANWFLGTQPYSAGTLVVTAPEQAPGATESGAVCEQVTTVSSCPDQVVSVSAYPLPKRGEEIAITTTDPREADRRSTLLERERFMNQDYADRACARPVEVSAFQEPVNAKDLLRDPETLKHWKYSAVFTNAEAVAFFTRLAAATDDAVDMVCRTEAGVVAMTTNRGQNLGFWLQPRGAAKVARQNFAGRIFDGAYQMYPDFVDGKALLRTGYGDAGSVWWEYYLHNFATGKDEKVESCTGTYSEEEQLKDGKIQFTYTYKCDLAYIPAP